MAAQLKKHSILLNLSVNIFLGIIIATFVMLALVARQVSHEVDEIIETRLVEAARFYQLLPKQVLMQIPSDLVLDKDYSLFAKYSLYNIKTKQLIATNQFPPFPIDATGKIDLADTSWQTHSEIKNDQKIIVAISLDVRNYLAADVAKDVSPVVMICLLLLGIAMIFGVWRGLAPLRLFSQEVACRPGDDLSAFTMPVPKEIEVLPQALNQLLIRIAEFRQREQRFVADAAHELRTPLAGILLSLDVIETTQRQEAKQRGLRNIRLSTQRAHRLVEQLLLLARVDSQVMTLKQNSLIEVVKNKLQEIKCNGGIKIDFSTSDETDCLVQLDEDLIAVMLRNAIDNSEKYGASTVQVSVNNNCLTIEDNGPGVSQEVLANLGNRFYRPAGQKISGSGIGLSLIKEIAALHHAEVNFSSPAGFSITIQFPSV